MHSLVTARPHDRPSSAYYGASGTQLLFFTSIKTTRGCGVSQPQDCPPENLDGKFLRL